MESDKIELAERLVNSSRWQWMPGMRTINGRRIAVVFGESRTASVLCDLRDDANSDTEDLQGELPDLADPATLGCLLALVREEWRNPHIWVESSTFGRRAGAFIGWAAPEYQPALPDIVRATEAEALIVALESAP